jgi:hypothetical protein
MNASKHLHHIADDHQRGALVRIAVDKGMQQARGDFFYALLVEGLDDESLTMMAREAWDAISRYVEFDYPQFAQTLYLHGFRLGYRTHLRNLAAGKHESAHNLVAILEAEMGLSSTSAMQRAQDG